MIKALIFDLDNTLIDRQRAFSEMLYEVLGKVYKDPVLLKAMVDDILVFDHNGAVSRKIAFKQWADKYQVTELDPEEMAANWSKQSGSVAYLFDDVRPTLSKLKEKYKIAVLSNGDASSQRRKMATIAIDDLLDYSLISGEFGISKPDPRIFQYTCAQLGCKPEECVYIGDSYHIDIEGSRNAGLNAVYASRNNEEHPDVKTVLQICELLEFL